MVKSRRTKIVATVGPSSDGESRLEALLSAGVDVFRLNLSHGNVTAHRERILRIHQVRERVGSTVAVMLDTRGPEVRLGTFPGGSVRVAVGAHFFLYKSGQEGSEDGAPVNWPGLIDASDIGATLLLDDGNLVMRVVDKTQDALELEVLVGGELKDRKKVSAPGSVWPLPALSETDREILAMGAELGMDYVAASFIRNQDDLTEVRKLLEDLHSEALVISKIESPEAIINLEEIIRGSDGVMVARGDLGVEVPAEQVPDLQKAIIHRANQQGIPVITATQMLESMVHQPQPTRAEATDVANAIWDGSDAVMLSAETASGEFPVEAVAVMAKLAANADAHPEYLHRTAWDIVRVSEAVAKASAEAAEGLGADAILTVTQSGYTARMLSRSRTAVPIVALSSEPRVVRQMHLLWGVTPLKMQVAGDSDDMMTKAVDVGLGAGVVHVGDLVVFTAGVPAGVPGTTNLMRIETIVDSAIRGQGISVGPAVRGRVVHLHDVPEGQSPASPYVLVAHGSDSDRLDLIQHATAIIAETGGLTSPLAILGLDFKVPTVVAVPDAHQRLRTGQWVVVDATRGLVYADQDDETSFS